VKVDDLQPEEIWINDPSGGFIARNGRHELTKVILTKAKVQELVERMLKSSGRRIDLSQPFVDAHWGLIGRRCFPGPNRGALPSLALSEGAWVKGHRVRADERCCR
jgi:Flp pilus assembly CpaF family ATPase